MFVVSELLGDRVAEAQGSVQTEPQPQTLPAALELLLVSGAAKIPECTTWEISRRDYDYRHCCF